MKKSEMVYGDPRAFRRGFTILRKGQFHGVNWYVLNVKGGWPCAYIDVTGSRYDETAEFNKLKKQGRENFWKNSRRSKLRLANVDLNHVVHGGITYSAGTLAGVCEKRLNEDCDRWFLGWDYAHYGDMVWYSQVGMQRGRKWSVDEIVSECKTCIKELKKAEKSKRS